MVLRAYNADVAILNVGGHVADTCLAIGVSTIGEGSGKISIGILLLTVLASLL